MKCKRVGSGRLSAFRDKRDAGRILGKRAFPSAEETTPLELGSSEEEIEEA